MRPQQLFVGGAGRVTPPPPKGPVKIWTRGGDIFVGDNTTWDVTSELLTLNQTGAEPIVIDIAEIVAYQVQPATP